MFLLDTNVISELRRRKPHGAVLAWLRTVSSANLHVAAMTIGELQTGVERTREADPAKADELELWLAEVIAGYSVVSADAAVFRRWAQLVHRKPAELQADAMIAATAIVHSFTLVSRDVSDFAALGVECFNPFEFQSG